MGHAALPGPADLLAVWESGLDQPPAGRALTLHRAARPDAGPADLRAEQVGRRETDLYALRRALFGDRMQVVTDCVGCGHTVEFDLDAARLGRAESDRAARQSATDGGAPLRVTEDGWDITFRPPTVADLEAAASAVPAGAAGPNATPVPAGSVGDVGSARQALIARCTVTATRDGTPVPADQLARSLPESVANRLADAAAEADPAADVTLLVACAECGHRNPADLDIAAYLWDELDAWARDILLDVHLLALSYGWTEPQVLALSPARRRYYLELCADA